MDVAASSRAIGFLSRLGFVAVVVLHAGASVELQFVGQIQVGANAAHIIEPIEGIQQL